MLSQGKSMVWVWNWNYSEWTLKAIKRQKSSSRIRAELFWDNLATSLAGLLRLFLLHLLQTKRAQSWRTSSSCHFSLSDIMEGLNGMIGVGSSAASFHLNMSPPHPHLLSHLQSCWCPRWPEGPSPQAGVVPAGTAQPLTMDGWMDGWILSHPTLLCPHLPSPMRIQALLFICCYSVRVWMLNILLVVSQSGRFCEVGPFWLVFTTLKDSVFRHYFETCVREKLHMCMCVSVCMRDYPRQSLAEILKQDIVPKSFIEGVNNDDIKWLLVSVKDHKDKTKIISLSFPFFLFARFLDLFHPLVHPLHHRPGSFHSTNTQAT